MSDRILLNPENRGLATSGSNDFSLYGAQPDPAVLLRAAQDESSPSETGTPSPAAASPPERDGSEAPTANVVNFQQPQSSSLVPQPTLSLAEPTAPGDTASKGTSHSDGAPTGSLIPIGLAAVAFPAGATFPAANVPAAGAPAPFQAASTVAPAEAVSLAPPSLPNAAQALPAPADTVTIFAPTAAPGALGEVSAILSDHATGVSGTLSEAGNILSGPATGAFATLGTADPAADAADDVQDLLGADPTAGIATLVSLVSISDVLPVTDAANDAGEAAEDLSNDLLDSLAADPPESNLLGTDADDAAPAAGLLTTPPPVADVDLPGGLG